MTRAVNKALETIFMVLSRLWVQLGFHKYEGGNWVFVQLACGSHLRSQRDPTQVSISSRRPTANTQLPGKVPALFHSTAVKRDFFGLARALFLKFLGFSAPESLQKTCWRQYLCTGHSSPLRCLFLFLFLLYFYFLKPRDTLAPQS